MVLCASGARDGCGALSVAALHAHVLTRASCPAMLTENITGDPRTHGRVSWGRLVTSEDVTVVLSHADQRRQPLLPDKQVNMNGEDMTAAHQSIAPPHMPMLKHKNNRASSATDRVGMWTVGSC